MVREQKSKKVTVETGRGNGTSTPALVALAAAVVGYFVWRRCRQTSKQKDPEGKGSAFKFPAAKAAPLEGLSRNKLGNNKKNKARRAEKKHKKAEKQRQQLEDLPHKKAGGSGSGDQAEASTAVLNYSYFDSARRDTIGMAQKKPKLTAEDVMQQQQQSGAKKQ